MAREKACRGTAIGMKHIKNRRLELPLRSHQGLMVGSCVPFYFCPRSVMLYVLHKSNDPDLYFRDGQRPIIHLVADAYETIRWAESNDLRWAFTLSNAGSSYFEDRSNLSELDQINWNAVVATQWSNSDIKDAKQAEFLVEQRFPWRLVVGIGVHDHIVRENVRSATAEQDHKPIVKVMQNWYY